MVKLRNSDGYVCSENAQCPNRLRHRYDYPLDVIGDSQYRCGCGCQFEWYYEGNWFVIEDGRKELRALPNNNMLLHIVAALGIATILALWVMYLTAVP